MGRMMTDKTPRLWHVVGSNLNYAFIINNDTILEKTADGALDVYDAHMNPVKNYRLPAKQFDHAIKKLPILFVKEKGKKGAEMVNYKVRNDCFVVDRTFPEAELKLDNETVKIRTRH